jgi:hypothetical protein
LLLCQSMTAARKMNPFAIGMYKLCLSPTPDWGGRPSVRRAMSRSILLPANGRLRLNSSIRRMR